MPNKSSKRKKYAFKGKKNLNTSKSKKKLEKIIQDSVSLYQQGKLIEALELTEESLIIYPDSQTLLTNAAGFSLLAGNLLKNKGNFLEAEKYYQKALQINPNYDDAYNNLGELFNRKKQFDQAENYYQKTLKINPNYADARWNLSLLQLTLANLRQGWENYESRYHSNRHDREFMGTILPTSLTPQYQNKDLDIKDKHFLICPEQGVGDEIMFASLLSELEVQVKQNKGTHITLACDTRLVDLFSRSFDFLTATPKNKDNRYVDLEKDLDYWLFISSLPKFYRNSIKDFERHKPYLKADNMLLRKWQDRFSQLQHKLNIGISWTGGAKAENKKDRSLTLEQMLPILTKANQSANIINLQYGDHTQEIQNFKAQTGIIIHDWDDADPLKDLDNFAAQIKALDLVISIDNSTVHFAGALGTKTFVMLPFNQDWRWMEDRDDSPWYPNTMKLFRQTKDSEWDMVIQNVTSTLEHFSKF